MKQPEASRFLSYGDFLNTQQSIPTGKGEVYNKKSAAFAFVGFKENGDAIFRGTDDKDVIRPVGTFVTRKKSPTAQAPRGLGDMIVIPADVLAATKHMSEKVRSAVHQAFAEQEWAKIDKTGLTKEQDAYKKQQTVEIEKIGSEIAAKAEEAAKAKARKKE